MNEKDDSIEKKKIDDEVVEYYVNENERKYPPFILVILLTTFSILIALGISFSTITFIENNETINTIISNLKGKDNKDKYIITYIESRGDGDTSPNGIYLINQFPTSDQKGKLFKGENYVFNFSLLVGKRTKDVYYEITAVENRTNNLNPDYVKVYLEKNGVGVNHSFRNNNKVKVYTEYQKSKYDGVDGRVIYQGFITQEDIKKGKIDFVMRMWVSEDVKVDSDYVNKKFVLTVNTYATSMKVD